MLGLHCCMWSFFSCDEWELFSSCAEQASHWSGLSYCGTWILGLWASGVTAHGFNCSEVCGISPDQGSNPLPLVLAGRFLTTGPPRESQSIFKVWVLPTFHVYIVIYLSFIFIGFLKSIHLHSNTFISNIYWVTFYVPSIVAKSWDYLKYTREHCRGHRKINLWSWYIMIRTVQKQTQRWQWHRKNQLSLTPSLFTHWSPIKAIMIKIEQ